MFLKYGECTWRTDFFVNLNINRYMWLVATIFDAACLEGTISSSGHIPLIQHLMPCCGEGWNWRRSRWGSVKLEGTCLSCPRLKIILHNSSPLTLKQKILNAPFTLTYLHPYSCKYHFFLHSRSHCTLLSKSLKRDHSDFMSMFSLSLELRKKGTCFSPKLEHIFNPHHASNPNWNTRIKSKEKQRRGRRKETRISES